MKKKESQQIIFPYPKNDKKSDIERKTIVLAHYSHLPG
jgi:hypothetical protein